MLVDLLPTVEEGAKRISPDTADTIHDSGVLSIYGCLVSRHFASIQQPSLANVSLSRIYLSWKSPKASIRLKGSGYTILKGDCYWLFVCVSYTFDPLQFCDIDP